MKKLNYILLPLLLIISLLFGCSQPRVKIDNLHDRIDEFLYNGSPIFVEGKLFSGIAFQGYKNGVIYLEAPTKNGVLHGSLKAFLRVVFINHKTVFSVDGSDIIKG